MKSDLSIFWRWLQRARPPRTKLFRALVAGFAATLINVAMFIGAVALLVESAQRPGLRAIAVVLVVIELFAFLRSPLRFFERLSAHELGFEAVTTWRRWLTLRVGAMSFSTWRTYAAGDLLERALDNTDDLQDLWLRCVVPLLDTFAVLVLGDFAIAVLPPKWGWSTCGASLFVLQLLGILALVLVTRRDLSLDRSLRRANAHYRSELVELSSLTPEVTLLGRGSFSQGRLDSAAAELSMNEAALVTQRRHTTSIVLLVGLGSVAITLLHPRSSSVWYVVAVMFALSSFEAFLQIRSCAEAAVNVRGAAEQLETLETSVLPRDPWPTSTVLSLRELTLREGGEQLLLPQHLTIREGQRVALVGESGVGKSALLRALVGLDDCESGSVRIGDTDIASIEESELRSHVAYVPSEPGFTRGFARDVLSLGRTITRDVVDDVAALGINCEANTRFAELSRGERIRVAIARSGAISPDIWVLDEPTAALGVDETARVLEFLSRSSATFVIATHDPTVVQWCERVLELRGAQLIDHALSEPIEDS